MYAPPRHRQFFLNGKALPVERGGGAAQPVIGVAARRLAAGDWLHVFPEGRVQPAGDVGAFRQVHWRVMMGW
jgi:monolysocardiolipin acyltransferase